MAALVWSQEVQPTATQTTEPQQQNTHTHTHTHTNNDGNQWPSIVVRVYVSVWGAGGGGV
jgi:hypothetical protein